MRQETGRFHLFDRLTVGPQQVSEVNKFKGLAVKRSLARALVHKGISAHCQKPNWGLLGAVAELSDELRNTLALLQATPCGPNFRGGGSRGPGCGVLPETKLGGQDKTGRDARSGCPLVPNSSPRRLWCVKSLAATKSAAQCRGPRAKSDFPFSSGKNEAGRAQCTRGLSRRNALWGASCPPRRFARLRPDSARLDRIGPARRPFGTLTRASCWQNWISMID